MSRKDNRINLPSSGAGLTKYFDDYQSKVLISPEMTIFIILGTAVLILLLSGKLF